MNLRLALSGTALLFAAAQAYAGPHVAIGVRIGLPAPIFVREAPPPRIVERVYTSPGSGYVWVPGHYTWAENRWVWLNGAWTLPPEPAAYWVDSRWNPDTRQWTDAHWEVPVVAPSPAPQPLTAPPAPSSAPNSSGTQVPVPSSPPPSVAGSSESEVIVSEPPPPPMNEVIIESPGRGYVWVSGYWGWIGGRREWIRGHWERPPHRHAVWIAPRWEHRGRDYVYIRGFWR